VVATEGFVAGTAARGSLIVRERDFDSSLFGQRAETIGNGTAEYETSVGALHVHRHFFVL